MKPIWNSFSSFDGTSITTEVPSINHHRKVSGLGNYKDAPFVTGSDYNSAKFSFLKTEILDYEMDTWEVKEDFPFSTNKYVHWYFEFAENPLNILRFIQYATVSTDESVF